MRTDDRSGKYSAVTEERMESVDCSTAFILLVANVSFCANE